jgi:hypothetical protein
MNPSDHARNKLVEISDDERVAQAISSVLNLVRACEADYAVIGSCGLQAYLSCFFRLPNDLDLVLPDEGSRRILQGAREMGWEVIEQLGRNKLVVDRFPVHLIPVSMAVIDKATDRIFASVDLSGELATAKEKRVTLVGSTRSPHMRLASLEAILFIEMIRPIYTGSVMGIALALRERDINDEAMAALIRAHRVLQPILMDRVTRLPDAVLRMTILPEPDRELAAKKLRDLWRVFEA